MGADWLARQQRDDGEMEGCGADLAGYYKSALMFAMCGRNREGAKCLRYIRDHLLCDDGELAANGQKTSLVRMQRNLANYMDGWVVIGSWLLGDYRLADSVSARLESAQSTTHGGILTGPEKWSGPERFDLATTASCGRAFLLIGRRDAARRAADFLTEALRHQPESSALQLSFNERWGPVSEPDEGERTYYTFDPTQRGEKVWFPAFSAAYLSEAFQVFGQRDHLDAAISYFRWIEQTPELEATTLANGKSGWAAGLLAEVTEGESYREALRWIVPNVIARQRADGEFGASPRSAALSGTAEPHDRAPDTTELAQRYERTAEFTTWSAVFLRMHAGGVFDTPGAGTHA
jgi:hypothetical protein